MNKYMVSIYYSACDTRAVSAETPEEAADKAMRAFEASPCPHCEKAVQRELDELERMRTVVFDSKYKLVLDL